MLLWATLLSGGNWGHSTVLNRLLHISLCLEMSKGVVGVMSS